MGITVSNKREVWKAACSYIFSLFAGGDDITSPAAATAGPTAKAPALFAENYARLQKLKKQYDPDLVFFKWNPISPQA